MDAAVSLHVHGALPLPASLQPPLHHHHHLKPSPASSSKPPTRLTATARPRALARSAPSAVPTTRSSSRAATGYAAALADASLRAGTLLRASRHARALLLQPQHQQRPQPEEEELDARVGKLVRMLVSKGKAGMVAEVMAEFAAICDHLLLLRQPPARAHPGSSY